MRLALILWLLAAAPAAAQAPPERLPWFVIDAHGATVGLPQAEGWVPAVSSTTLTPGRYWGLSVGGTVYPVRIGLMTLGLGGALIKGSGTAETLGPPPTTTTAGTTRVTGPAPVLAAVTTSVTHMVPHLSLNFGRKQGWSYISAGLGRSKSSSVRQAMGATPELTVPESWEQAANFGGGARWFMKPHIGAGFDVRFIMLPSRASGTVVTNPTSPNLTPPVPGNRLWNISVGISIQ